jgi:hypothetical protein
VKLPSRITLPSGARVELRLKKERPRGASFADALAALEEDIASTKDGAELDVSALALADFHVLRAVLAKCGILREEPVAITCRNCGEPMDVQPCEGLEIGPWVDGELGDEELDATLPLGEPHAIEPIRIGRVRQVRSITLGPVTVAKAKPLFAALAKEHFAITPAVVRAMGVVALGREQDPARIADALASCDDDAFAVFGDVWLAAHYPPRLVCAAFCKACGARNDVDAPYDRELEPGVRGEPEVARDFPAFEPFAERAQAIAKPLVDDVPGERVDVVVDEGTPAVDDGGEPLLGSYVPPHPGGGGAPARAPLVTIYYRTFKAMWDEDGPYDWDAELVETIEHELEHHVYFLRGEDPMDDEERAAIREEAVRLVGRKEATRRAAQDFGSSVRDFLARTWPLWLLVALALAIAYATQR